MQILVESLGFKYGPLPEADLMVDVRFLPNPYYDEALRPFSGKDACIQKYLEEQEETSRFLAKEMDLLFFLLPQFENTGRELLHLAFACTGGRHRSVYISETVSKHLEEAGYEVTLRHRDILKDGQKQDGQKDGK